MSPTLEFGKGGPEQVRDGSKVMNLANKTPTQVMCFHSATTHFLCLNRTPAVGNRHGEVWKFPNIRKLWRNLFSSKLTQLSAIAVSLGPGPGNRQSSRLPKQIILPSCSCFVHSWVKPFKPRSPLHLQSRGPMPCQVETSILDYSPLLWTGIL